MRHSAWPLPNGQVVKISKTELIRQAATEVNRHLPLGASHTLRTLPDHPARSSRGHHLREAPYTQIDPSAAECDADVLLELLMCLLMLHPQQQQQHVRAGVWECGRRAHASEHRSRPVHSLEVHNHRRLCLRDRTLCQRQQGPRS